MSYRTFKKLMGETSLERKCRLLFGGGLMLLITGSFYFYAKLNENLVREQTIANARKLVESTMLLAHWQASRQKSEKFPGPVAPFIQEFYQHPREMFGDKDPETTIPHTGDLIGIYSTADSSHLRNRADYDVLNQIRSANDEEKEVTLVRKDKEGHEQFVYYRGIIAKKSCVDCHNIDPVFQAKHKGTQDENKLIGIVRIEIPLQETNQQIARNKAILLGMAIATAFLAMLAAYLIVRYVIVKPVLHLKDVSDGITKGTLDLRADIRTGDEFEELSHAFNRMLRHLTTVQEELRGVNSDLDAKVDELAQVNLQLYEMNKLKDEFLATMSHELRTPLNSILGFSDILSTADNLNDKQKRYLKNIKESGEDLMARINDVLDLAKIESGKMDILAVEFALSDLIERQVASLAPLADTKNIQLNDHVSDGLPTLYQDSGKVQQIVTNLLSNAIKFTPEGGLIRVIGRRSEADPEFVELLVEDTGIGIRLEDQETIFEKFRQGRLVPGQQDNMKREYGGTGLGLSIVKELSVLLGGEVALTSEFGKGSTFTVTLPIRVPQTTMLEVRQPPEQPRESNDPAA